MQGAEMKMRMKQRQQQHNIAGENVVAH